MTVEVVIGFASITSAERHPGSLEVSAECMHIVCPSCEPESQVPRLPDRAKRCYGDLKQLDNFDSGWRACHVCYFLFPPRTEVHGHVEALVFFFFPFSLTLSLSLSCSFFFCLPTSLSETQMLKHRDGVHRPAIIFLCVPRKKRAGFGVTIKKKKLEKLYTVLHLLVLVLRHRRNSTTFNVL